MSALIVCHIVSGDAFFSGIALVLAALLVRCASNVKTGRLAAPVGVTGALLFAISSTGPTWLVAGWLALLIAAAAAAFSLAGRCRWVGRIMALAATVLMLAGQVPALFVSGCPPAGVTLYVVGDSISAGIDRHSGANWPAVYSQQYGAAVISLARPGATLRSALEQVRAIPPDAKFVLLEIGGNDLLRGASIADVRRDLEALLHATQAPGRFVCMCELPLPPFHNAWSTTQRSLAARHHVALIPKRRLARVLTAPGSTTDGLHLSPRGDELFADMVWSAFSSRAPRDTPPGDTADAELQSTLRVASWNIQKARAGTDALAHEIADLRPDVVLVQEGTRRRPAGGFAEDAGEIAAALGLSYVSDCAPLDADRDQCIAILSRQPLRNAERLHTREDRAYGLCADATVGSVDVRLVCVHVAGTWKLDPAHVP